MDTPASMPPKSTADTPPLSEAVQESLKAASGPLAFAQLKTALGKAKALITKGMRKTTDADIAGAIKELSDLGRCYACGSGKSGGVRYWVRDETQALRDAAAKLATAPQPMAKLVTVLKAAAKGVDPRYAEGVIRDLIGDGKLHEHPPKTAQAAPLFGTTPPPPPPPPPAWYESKGYKTPFKALVKAAAKVFNAGDRSLVDILLAVRSQLDPDTADENQPADRPGRVLSAEQVAELERLIVDIVSAQKPVAIMSIADLRAELPTEFRGPAFDSAVLRLANSHKVRVQKDAVPEERTIEQQALFVKSGQGTLFTSISV